MSLMNIRRCSGKAVFQVVPTVLSKKNKKDRIICCKRILKDVSVSKSDVYCVQDELWIDWDIVRTKNSSKTWLKKGIKRLQIPKPKLTPKKTMLLVSFTYSPARFSVTALPKGETVTADYIAEYLKDTGNRKTRYRSRISSSRWIMQDCILQREHRHTWSRTDCRLFLKVPIAQILTCVTNSSSPGCKNTTGRKNTARAVY